MFNYPYNNYYVYPSGYNDFISSLGDLEVQNKNERLSYYNVAASFDIETSSLYTNNVKFATMYIWQFGVNGSVIIGRTWVQLSQFISQLIDDLSITIHKRLVVYVHNLAYEFQFINKRFNWAKDSSGNNAVFSLKKRRPIYALTKEGIEFRCSYFLSNCSLSYIGSEMLFKYPVKKLMGDLDYNLIRTSITPLTDEELAYCINDVRVVMSYIQEKKIGRAHV